MDRGAWPATFHGVTKESNMTERVTTGNNAYVALVSAF